MGSGPDIGPIRGQSAAIMQKSRERRMQNEGGRGGEEEEGGTGGLQVEDTGGDLQGGGVRRRRVQEVEDPVDTRFKIRRGPAMFYTKL